MHVVTLTLGLGLSDIASLKDKRAVVKGLLARLHREFNVSAAEVEGLDQWAGAVIACAMVTNDPAHGVRAMETILRWLERHRPDLRVDDQQIELR